MELVIRLDYGLTIPWVQRTDSGIVAFAGPDAIRLHTPLEPGGEGVFLPCSFWLADALALMGRQQEARRLFGRLLTLRNGLGLISEEFDTKAGRLIGNFPQAFTHLAVIKTAALLASRVVFEEPASDLAPAA